MWAEASEGRGGAATASLAEGASVGRQAYQLPAAVAGVGYDLYETTRLESLQGIGDRTFCYLESAGETRRTPVATESHQVIEYREL